MTRPSNIVLVGFMGTGKSAVAREISARLGWEVIDTDARIEKEAGRSVGEIFDREGEAAFRDRETAVIRALAKACRHTVVSAGGGAVLRDENWEALKALGPVVCLTASVDVILERTQKSRTRRPLLEVENPRAEIEKRLGSRAPFYARADYQISTDGKSSAQVTSEVLKVLGIEEQAGAGD